MNENEIISEQPKDHVLEQSTFYSILLQIAYRCLIQAENAICYIFLIKETINKTKNLSKFINQNQGAKFAKF